MIYFFSLSNLRFDKLIDILVYFIINKVFESRLPAPQRLLELLECHELPLHLLF